MMKKLSFLSFVILFFVLFSFFASASESDEKMTMPEEYSDFLGSLPDDIIDRLPEGFCGTNIDEIGEAVKEISDVRALLSFLLDGLMVGVREILPTLSVAAGMLLVFSLINQMSVGFINDNLTSFISRVTLLSVIMGLVYNSIQLVSKYFTQLCRMTIAYIPLSAVLYAMGGNVTTAVTASLSFGICLSVCQFIFTYTAIPVLVFSLALAIASSFCESKALSAVFSGVNKYYTILLSFVMSVLCISISAQTFISAKADNAAMRGAKIAIGSFIPISGGAVSSSLGAIASGVELIRGCVGIGGIVIIVMLLIPLLSHLILMKLFFFALETVEGAVGESIGVVSRMSSLYSYLLGIAAISSTVFILMFALLGFCVSAVR